jgi:hypothetical protein
MPVLSSLREKTQYITSVGSNSQASSKWSGGKGKFSKYSIVCYTLKMHIMYK